MRSKVLVRGAGDIATGIIHRLYQSGFQVLATEVAQPTVIRRTVSFAEAIYTGSYVVEEVTGVRVSDLEEANQAWANNQVPILVDPSGESAKTFQPDILVDAILAKKNLGTHLDMAPIVIGIGPGFTANEDCHAVVETSRGHHLGRVYWKGSAIPNTGIPGVIGGAGRERVVHAPLQGVLMGLKEIGDHVEAGEPILTIDDQPVVAPISGVLRGLLRSNTQVKQGLKIADIDPRDVSAYIHLISDKARAVAGGVLEAILHGSP